VRICKRNFQQKNVAQVADQQEEEQHVLQAAT